MRQGAFLNILFELQLFNPRSLINYKQGQYFSKIFKTIWRTRAKFQVLFNSATCSNYSITNYVTFPVFNFFEIVNKGELKIVNIIYQNWQILFYCYFIKIIKGPETSFQSPALSQEHVRKVCYKIR